MKPTEATWVYEHVICGYHDANEANWWCGPDQSGDRLICACQIRCAWCRDGQHQRCRRAAELRQRHTELAREAAEDGQPTRPWKPLGHGPETHLRAPGPWRPNNPKRSLHVAVWLADRVCRYLCTCTVCQALEPSPEAGPDTAPEAWDHGVLFDLGAA